jgi:pyruvate dehydrogenase E2 component (dihydrolipoamide acetyltransferase)
VNAPEVAILGISRAEMQPKWDGEAFVPRLIMPFSLSYDHRVIDGAEGVRFTGHLARSLGDIRRLLL